MLVQSKSLRITAEQCAELFVYYSLLHNCNTFLLKRRASNQTLVSLHDHFNNNRIITYLRNTVFRAVYEENKVCFTLLA